MSDEYHVYNTRNNRASTPLPLACYHANIKMCWLIGNAPDFWGRGPDFESGISHNDPDALQDHCDKVENLRVKREIYP